MRKLHEGDMVMRDRSNEELRQKTKTVTLQFHELAIPRVAEAHHKSCEGHVKLQVLDICRMALEESAARKAAIIIRTVIVVSILRVRGTT